MKARTTNSINLDADEVMRRRFADYLDVDGYFNLLNWVDEGRIADESFQKKFNGFCMVRRDVAWRAVYYRLFAELAERRGGLALRDVLPELTKRLQKRRLANKFEVSFASKMLAFLEPGEYPIWDRRVVENMRVIHGVDLRLNESGGMSERISDALEKFEALTTLCRKALESRSMKRELSRFDAFLPDGMGAKIHPMKKLDWLIWAQRPASGNK